MSDETLRALTWVGVGVGIVIVFMVIEFVMRMLANRYGTPQEGYPHRTSTQVPRAEQ